MTQLEEEVRYSQRREEGMARERREIQLEVEMTHLEDEVKYR